MVEDTETRTKGSRKGKNTQVRVDNDATNKNEPEAIDNEADEDTDSDSDFDDGDKRYNFHTLAKLLEPMPKLMSRNYYSWNAHVKSFLRSVPHAMKHLEGTYDKKHPKWSRSLDDALINALHGTIDTTGEYNKCTIWHPVYKETVATVHQIDFNTLTTALSIRQTAVESVPAQKIDPRQASARTAGNDDQNKWARETEAKADNSHASSRNAGRPCRIRCWICKRSGHGISQCDASVTIPKDSPLAKPK
ncbi:uncharacterized protein UHOD_11078 [Ustilago sp. UG-2017b]|nr:uncharacterized protein UHOD_11078 [Ustilago sp. UG-2017b]